MKRRWCLCCLSIWLDRRRRSLGKHFRLYIIYFTEIRPYFEDVVALNNKAWSGQIVTQKDLDSLMDEQDSMFLYAIIVDALALWVVVTLAWLRGTMIMRARGRGRGREDEECCDDPDVCCTSCLASLFCQCCVAAQLVRWSGRLAKEGDQDGNETVFLTEHTESDAPDLEKMETA